MPAGRGRHSGDMSNWTIFLLLSPYAFLFILCLIERF